LGGAAAREALECAMTRLRALHRSVYVFSTADGHLIRRIAVGDGPHGLCVWPQPGRYSLGHTGITR